MYCRSVLWVPGPAGQYSGKIRFIEKPGVEDEGGRHVVKRSSDPRVAHPDVKVQVRVLVRVVGIVAPFAPMGASTLGKFVLSNPRGENRHMRPDPGAPSSGTPRESQAKFRDGTVWVL